MGLHRRPVGPRCKTCSPRRRSRRRSHTQLPTLRLEPSCFGGYFKHVAQRISRKLPFENAPPRGSVGLDVDVIDAAGTNYLERHIRFHNFQSRSAVLPGRRLEELPFSFGVLVRVMRNRRVRVDVVPQTVSAKHLGPGGDQVHLFVPRDDVHGDVESVVLQGSGP